MRLSGAVELSNVKMRAPKNDGFFPPGAKSKMSTIRTFRATLRSVLHVWKTRNGGLRGTLSRSASSKKHAQKPSSEPQNVVPPVIHMYWNQYIMLGEQ